MAHAGEPTKLESPTDLARYCQEGVQPTLASYSTPQLKGQTPHKGTTYSIRLDSESLPASETSEHILEVPLSETVSLREGLNLDLWPRQLLRWANDAGSNRPLGDRYERGEFSVELIFVPPSFHRSAEPSCVHEGAASNMRGTLLEARLVDEDHAPVAVYQTDLGRALAKMRSRQSRLESHQVRPLIKIPRLVVQSAGQDSARSENADDPESPHSEIRGQLANHLLECYAIGLVDNARMQGALVVSWTSGDSESGRILIDSVGHARATSCVKERLGTIAGGPVTTAGKGTFKATVIFKLTSADSP